MTTGTRTAEQLTELLQGCRAVQAVKAWGEGNGRRFYLNLWDASRTFRGDQTEKWYVDARGVLNHDRGQGTRSPGFADSVEILCEFVAANEIEVRKVN